MGISLWSDTSLGVTRGGYARELAALIRLRGCSDPRQISQCAGSLDLAVGSESFR